MKKLFVFFAGNERGGAASHLTTLARTIVRCEKQDKYHFLALGDGPLATAVSATGASCEIIPSNVVRSVLYLTDVLRANPRTLLHSHGPRLNIIAAVAARRAGVPWTSTIHSHPLYDFLGNSLKSRLYPKLHLWSLRQAIGLFAVESSLSEALPTSTVLDVPNAVDVPALTKPRGGYSDMWRQQFHLSPESRFVGIAARFDPVKNIDVLIEAMSHLKTPSTHLLIAGDGSMKTELVELAVRLQVADRVHFLGFLSDMASFYAGIDVHVLPSKSEGTPFSVLEAGAYGAANVASDIPSLSRLLRNGEAGRLAPVGDAPALAVAIDRLLADEQARQSCIEVFASKVLVTFSPERMLEAYERGYTVLEEDIIRLRAYHRA